MQVGKTFSDEEIRELKEEWMGHLHADHLALADFLLMMNAVPPSLPPPGKRGSSASFLGTR